MQQKDEAGEAFREIYFAGGCFCGIEELMRSVPGVVDAVSGYANGRCGPVPSYEEVCSGRTGFSETVKVVYDSARVSLSALVFLFFRSIHPTDSGDQRNYRGAQYRSGIYYSDEDSAVVVRQVADVERRRHSAFYVEILPLLNFYSAEEFHQRYL